MVVGKERDQRQNRDDFHLHFIRLMRDALGHGMELEVEIADDENHHQDQHDDDDEEVVGLPRAVMKPGTWSVSAAW